MTHKNPELRTSSTVPDNQKKEPPVIGKKPAVLAKKPAKFELEDGNKWMVVC
jgi:adenylyl cyclase-associated protein